MPLPPSNGFKDFRAQRLTQATANDRPEDAHARPRIVARGYFGWFTTPCGTDGLGPCVGLVVVGINPAAGHLVAHFQCDNKVRSAQSHEYMWVWASTFKWLVDVTGTSACPAHIRVYASTTSTDWSTRAIKEAIKDWAPHADISLGYTSIMLTKDERVRQLAGTPFPKEFGSGRAAVPTEEAKALWRIAEQMAAHAAPTEVKTRE